MREDQKRPERRYESLKQKLWNQPRPRQFLERLERHGARPALLARVAGLFVTGRHGEADILAAIYSDLLRHRDHADLLRRIADLHVISFQIRQDLCLLANELSQARDPQASARRLQLSQRALAALLSVGEEPPSSLDPLLKRLTEEYGKKPQGLLLRTEDWGENRRAFIIELKRTAALQGALSRLHRNLLHLICELDRFKSWEAYRTAGYKGFSEFSIKELGFSEEVAARLILAREFANRWAPGELLSMILKGDGACERKEKRHEAS